MNLSRLEFIKGLFGAAATAIVPSVIEAATKRTYAVMSLCPQTVVFKPENGEAVVISPAWNGIATYVEVDEGTIMKLRGFSEYRRFIRSGHVAEFVRNGNRYDMTPWNEEQIEETKVCNDTSTEYEISKEGTNND